LRAFFHRVVLASLPLATPYVVGCASVPAIGDAGQGGDLVVASGGGELATTGGVDLAGNGQCGQPSLFIPVDGGSADAFDCESVCNPAFNLLHSFCQGAAPSPGLEGVLCHVDCTGRRPATLLPAGAARGGGALGRLFATMAHLEDASVRAFQILRDELVAHGAPRHLVARARRAVGDEIRHARLTAALARRFGGEPERASVAPGATRPLLEVAIENAAEGCVRESFGALVATWQSRAATDREVRAAMTLIAEDETLHAELAWAVAAWAEPRLAASEQARVDEARRAALAALADEVRRPTEPSLVAVAGLPAPATAEALYTAFAAEVHRRAAA
jgi:hypothetical protein